MTGRFSDGEILSGRFEIVRFLAAGGMGEVYEVEDRQLRGVRLALKTILPHIAAQPGMQERFEREVLLARRVAHANLCPIYDIFHSRRGEQHFTFLTMKLLTGETLATRLTRMGVVPQAEAQAIVEQVASALGAAHAAGILHRDIKTSNIMLQGSGERVEAVVMDFGLARPSASESTVMTLDGVAGTLGYMAPELLHGASASRASDIYAFGVVVYQMLTGQSPPVLHGGKPARSDAAFATLPAQWRRLIEGCLEPDAGLRIQSFSQAMETLREAPARTATWRTKKLVWLGSTVAVVTGAAWLVLRAHSRPSITDKDKIVLADFDNKTGDPVFDGTLRQGMTVQLEQSPFLSLVSDDRLQKTLALMGRTAQEKLTPEVGREICQRTGSAAVLDGSIASLGSQYVLGLRALNCETGDVLDAEQAQAARKEDVLAALSEVASKFRAKIGESLTTVKERNTPLQEATTSSLEALKAYGEGVKATTLGVEGSIPLYKRAIEIDPKFAMAYATLGRSYSDIGESALAVESTRRAYQMRDRTSAVERFFIDASYDIVVTGNLQKAQETCEAWVKTYPRDVHGYGFLSGMLYPFRGQFERAVEAGNHVIEGDPDAFYGYVNTAVAYQALGRLDEAEKTIQRGRDRNITGPDMWSVQYQTAWLRRDNAYTDRLLLEAPKDATLQEGLLVQEAFASGYTGRIGKAHSLSERAVSLAVQSGAPERAAAFSAGSVLRDAFVGDVRAIAPGASATLRLSKSRDIEYGVALALSLAGESAQAGKLADDIEKRFPEDTQAQSVYVPVVRAVLALGRHDGAKAVELLNASASYELGEPQCSFIGFYGLLYPVYVRGLAYLSLHRGGDAAVEFQRIIDHRTVVVTDPVGAIALLQLGRAYAVAGNAVKAKTAYEDFLALWKDGDPTVPLLIQARAEYAKL